jgi:cytochrome c553
VAQAASADPRADYLLHCGGCHRPDASGVLPSVPPLAGTLGRIIATAEGRDYVVRVPGASQTPLSDDALAAVMNWVLRNFNADTLPADFEPLTGQEVGQSRRNVLADPQQMRESLWPDY